MVAISPSGVWRTGGEAIAILEQLPVIDRLCPALSRAIEKEIVNRPHSVDGDSVRRHSRPRWRVSGMRNRTPGIRAPAEGERQILYAPHSVDDMSERL